MAEPDSKRVKLRSVSKLDCRTLNADDFVDIRMFRVEKHQREPDDEGLQFRDRTHTQYWDWAPRSVCQQYLDWLFGSQVGGYQKNLNLVDLHVEETPAGPVLYMFRGHPNLQLPVAVWHKISSFTQRDEGAFGVMTGNHADESTNPLNMRQVQRGLNWRAIDDVCQEVVLDCNWFERGRERRRDATGKSLSVEQLCANLAFRMEGLGRECKALERVILVGSWMEVNVCLEMIRHENEAIFFAFLEKVHFLVFRGNTDELTPHKAQWCVDLLGEHPNLIIDLERVETRPDIEYTMNPHRDRVYIRALRSTSPTIGNFSAHVEAWVEVED